MTKAEKIIWLTALILSAVTFVYNLEPIPQENMPPQKKGEYHCLPQFQEQANKLKPRININDEIKEYKLKIKKAPSYSETWRLEIELNDLIEQYNSQIKQYNQFLQQNCNNN